MPQDVASFEETQETLALLKLLALGQPDVEAGRKEPVAPGIRDYRQTAFQVIPGDLSRPGQPGRHLPDRRPQVATISAHNDPEIGQPVAEAMEKVGGEGITTVEESKTTETVLDVVEGMRFDRGYVSPYFVTDPEKTQSVLDEAPVLVTDRRINVLKDIIPLLEQIAKLGKPLLIIAEEVEGDTGIRRATGWPSASSMSDGGLARPPSGAVLFLDTDFAADQHDDVVQGAGDHAQQIIDGEDAGQAAMLIDHGDAADAERTHPPQGLEDIVVFVRGFDASAHDVLHGQPGGLHVLGEHFDDEVAIGDDADRPDEVVDALDDDEISDVVVAHQPRRFFDPGLALGNDNVAVAIFPCMHDRTPLCVAVAVERPRHCGDPMRRLG